MSNTRYHSIGLKVKEKQESNPGRQSDDRMGENSRGKDNLKRWVLSFERNVETDNELRVSGGREFQSLGAMTEKALLPRDVRTYGMDRTDFFGKNQYAFVKIKPPEGICEYQSTLKVVMQLIIIIIIIIRVIRIIIRVNYSQTR